MDTIKKIWGVGLLALLLIIAAPNKSKAQDISSQDFYDNLSQYGTWISDPQYGDVWVPDAEDDFRPYASRGHWVLTDYGNTWVSDYPWGWATFHYGRWHYDDYYGWEWIPGYEWAPAWVSWRQGGGYYGWAPLMPGISLSISFGGGYNVPDNYWVCAPQAYINRPNIYNYYAPHTTVINIIHRTTIINNTYVSNNRTYIAGPRAADIQRYTHQRPQVYHISNASAPGRVNVHNNAVTIFRPAVTKAPEAHPARVVDGAAYRRQNPSLSIAHHGTTGGAAVNHTNAARLATVARTTAPDNKVVRVNNRPNTAPVKSASHANTQQHTQTQPANKPTAPAQASPANTNGQHIGGARMHEGKPDNRPNVTPANPAAQQQLLQQQHQQQQAAQRQAQPAAQQQEDLKRQQQQAAQQAQQKQQAAQQAQAQQRQQQQAAQQAQAQQRQQRQAAQQAQAQQRQQQQATQQAQAQQRQQQQAAQQAQAQQRQQQQRPPQPPPQQQKQQQPPPQKQEEHHPPQ